jgi:hypothetical protein
MFEGLKYKIIKKKLLKKEIENISIEEMDRKHKDPSQELFNDSSYFNGIADDGSFFIVRQSFRTTRGNEYWLEVFFPDLGLLRLNQHPGEEGEGFKQGTLSFENTKVGKEWKVDFTGEMDLDGVSKKVKIALLFTAKTQIIDFQHAMIVDKTAKAIANEKWSKDFFEKLKDSKKNHFEQGGQLKGTIEIEGDIRHVDFSSMRDHSWGIRKWGGWKRHVWFGGMLENNESFNLSMVQYDYMGQLAAGFITEGDKTYYLREFPEIEEFAADPIFPDKLNLKFTYSNGKEYNLVCDRKTFVPYDMDGEYKIKEGISFGTLNGVPVKLVTEFGFNPAHYDI